MYPFSEKAKQAQRVEAGISSFSKHAALAAAKISAKVRPFLVRFIPQGEPQGPGLQVRLHPGDPRHPAPGRQGAGGEEDRLREEPQHPALCLRDAVHPVGQEAGRGGGAVQATHRPHQ